MTWENISITTLLIMGQLGIIFYVIRTVLRGIGIIKEREYEIFEDS
ncbi:MAG: hypothetical protein WC867_01865 [Candidatus Pacearchaeota archaeon]|jgi:hypothetical protein